VPSFHAYIDESGDDGFIFKPWPDRASSEWFVVSACVVRDVTHTAASGLLHAAFDPIERVRGAPIHFAKLSHEQRVATAHAIGQLPVRLISVCFNKPALPAGHTLSGNRRLYFYAVRYLLERISWLAREKAPLSAGDGTCRLHFSHCKGLSYAEMFSYLGRLQNDNTQIAWRYVDTAHPTIKAHVDSIWLRATDCVASGFARGLELTREGFCEDRYARLMKPRVYSHNHRIWSYGLKITPYPPAVESHRDNRYAWLADFRR